MGGYVASPVGAVAGAFGGAAAGIAAGFAYAGLFIREDGSGFEELEAAGTGLLVGAAVGAGLGSWLAVALVRHARPALTGALTAAIVPAIPGVLYRFVDTLESPRWLMPAIWLGLIAAAAIVARGVTAASVRRRFPTERLPPILWLLSAVEMVLVLERLIDL